MDSGQDGARAQGAAVEGRRGETQAVGKPQAQRQGESKGSVTGANGSADYQTALKAKDVQIAELQGKVANAAKTTEATEALNAEIAALKRQMADELVEFALKAAGARSVKVARALLEEHGGDVAALVAAEPRIFEGVEPTSQTSAGGAMGLESAGVAGGNDAICMHRWDRIAGLADEGKE